ncbi:Hsp20/alpha crystallin family protein [Nigerium massiliense]|uniref:Hsp20/alpha crystallin family protein n=1 Tax=Nigerium massiliense TaxID=1522317 RepID=UPI0006936FCE|nr:Hsp20/alpha crystallin family protein [Nigerium massiliense]
MATYDPFREMERLFNNVTTRTPASVGMPMDLYRTGDNFVAQIDLPGVDPSTIDIDMDGDTVTIRAERTPSVASDASWLTRERAVGTFARQLTLGRGLATDKISADYSDGVLTLTIPVAETAKPRKIEVQHSSRSLNVAGEVADDQDGSEQSNSSTEGQQA